nr:right-handed parallel beta-helix repeat-containing protein [Polymorphobacter sp.]
MIGKTTLVSNAVQLKAAAKIAKGGDTILLAPGNYGEFAFSSVRPTGTVTIKSANPNADAVFRVLTINNSANLVIEDVDVSRPLVGGVGLNGPAVRVQGSTDINLVGVDVSGSLNGNAWDDGHGLSVTGSNRITVLDSTFRQLDAAAIISRSSDIVFAGNSITEVREGVNISSTTGGLFDRNTIVNMQPNYAAGDHPDAFQVHSGGINTASSDLAFRNNVILEGTSGPIGGFFIRSERVAAGIEHSNISIENNYYQGTYRHGISVGDTNGLVITGNTVIDSAKAGNSTAITITNIDGARIEDNIAQMYLQTNSRGVTMADNVDVWEAKFKVGIAVSQLFAPTSAVGLIDFNLLNPLSNSVAAATGAGFRSTGQIGNLSGSTAAMVASYVPQFDHPFATQLMG